MYTNYIIIEHILKYLMISQIYSPVFEELDPIFKDLDF